MLVSKIMNTDVALFSIAPEASFNSAVEQMSLENLSCLVVKDKDSRPIGVITERDVTAFFANYLREPQATQVSVADVMTYNPVCVSEGCTCEDALTLSRSRKIRHFPVINDDYRLIGLVAQSNLLEAFASLLISQAKLTSNLKELRALSLEDPLMGIGNRRAMEVDLSFTQAEAKRHKKSYGLGLFDIDYFKKYNDHYGHQAGDEALRRVADTIKRAIRDSDRVYRYGGEELLVLMPESDLAAALVCGERVRQALESEAIPHAESPTGKLTISGGVAAAKGGDWKTLAKLADEALYQAKGAGRNRIASSTGERHSAQQNA